MFRRMALSVAIAFFCAAAFMTSAQAADKIGFANTLRLASETTAAKDAEQLMKNTFGGERTQLEKQRENISKQMEDFQKQAAALSEKARADRQQSIQKQMQEFQTKGEAFQQRVARTQQTINAQMDELIRVASRNYAKDNGYSVIIDASVAMFFLESADVTSGLIEEANKVWKSKGGKFNLTPAKK